MRFRKGRREYRSNFMKFGCDGKVIVRYFFDFLYYFLRFFLGLVVRYGYVRFYYGWF